MKFFSVKKFSTKVFAFGILLVLLVVGLTGVKNGKFLKDALTKQFQASIVDQTQLLAHKIQMTMTRWETKIGFFVQAILAIPEAQRSEALKILLGSESSVNGLLVFGASGRNQIIAEYFQNPKDKISVSAVLAEMKRHTMVISYHPTKKDLAWMGKKINGGSEYGDIIVVTLFRLSEIINGLEASSGNTQRLLLLDHNLTDILTKKTYAQILRESIKDPIFGKNAVETLSNDIGSGFLGETESQGKPTMVAYHRFEGSPLRLVVHQSGEPIERAIQSFLREMVQWSIFFLLMAILLAKLLVKGLLGGLATLFQATQKVSQGDFQFKVPIKSLDEIGLLGQSFNAMTDKIADLLVKEREKARIDKELETANAVQNTFFSGDSYRTPHLHIESYYKPASLCGGDWWGHFDLGDHRELVLIGDATGHGVPAALVTALAYSVSHQYAANQKLRGQSDLNPGELLDTLNNLLCQTLKGELFMTFSAIILDPKNNCLHFANAGHLFPLRLTIKKGPRGDIKKELQNNSPSEKPSEISLPAVDSYVVGSIIPRSNNGGILGVQADTVFTSEKHPFGPGDRVILYSDGLTEIYNQKGKQWGKRGLVKTLEKIQSPALSEIKDGIVKNSIEFNLNGDQFDDDVTVVIMENTTQESQVMAA